MKRTLTAGLVAALVFVSAACGDDEPSSTDTSPSAGPAAGSETTPETGAGATTDAPAGTSGGKTSGSSGATTSHTKEDTLPAPASEPADPPRRIVSLSPTHTEILFAIGAADQVVAVDSLSTYPDETEAVLTELSAFEPNVEAISGYEPDLVILPNDAPIVGQLAEIGVETWIGPAPATLDDAYAQIEHLGAMTGHAGEASDVVSGMEQEIAELTSDVPRPQRPLTYYHELDDTLYSVTSNTFIGSIYTMFGLRNIADQVEGDSGGYPQLNAEFIVIESPDMIFLADTVCCAQTAETVAARDGWDTIAAVRNGLVIEMNDDIASRWGPRIVDYVRRVRAAVEDAVALQPASFGPVVSADRSGPPGRAAPTGQHLVASGR